jgi:uncharacterized circularly permuted ATP-grasp superfamily protein/uncharacterized alpha-E superfamily protein
MDIAQRHEILKAYRNLPPGDLEALVNKARPELGELSPVGLDPLPFVIHSHEFPRLTRAAAQWGDLLTRVYQDLWGEHTLVKQGVLDGGLVWGTLGLDPAFFHSAAKPLSLLRFDLKRSADGLWSLVSLGTDMARGLGIALETRIAHSRYFGGKVAHGNLIRLAPFLQRLKDLWFESSLTHKDEPAIMVWTEGPSDPLYFEPAYLSRYFGYPLVESRDLTMRSGRVFLKTLGGLQPVDVLIRLVPDWALDPLAGNPGGIGGVAGLMQAVRDGTVAVTNAPGSGLLSHPALLPQYAAIGRHWGLEPELGYAASAEWGTDDFFDDGWQAAPVVVRLFAARFETGWELMPGGLVQRLSDGYPRFDGVRKDLWVLASEAVPQVTLLPAGERPSEITRAADLPSRVADDLFWLGRYTERAWVDLRFLEKWWDLRSGAADAPPVGAFLDSVVRNLSILGGTDQVWKQSRLSDTLGAIHRLAGQVLDRLSLETHRILRELGTFLDTEDLALPETLRQVNLRLAAFSGLTMESMTRAPGWRFLDMGRRLERALLVVESLQAFFVKGEENLPVLLDVFDSTLTYRSRYRLAPQRGPVLDLLLLDETNPRSLAFQLESLGRHVEELPRTSQRPYWSAEERAILDLTTRVRLTDGAALTPGSLEPFLAKLSTDLKNFSEALHQNYLAKIDTMAALQARAGEPG